MVSHLVRVFRLFTQLFQFIWTGLQNKTEYEINFYFIMVSCQSRIVMYKSKTCYLDIFPVSYFPSHLVSEDTSISSNNFKTNKGHWWRAMIVPMGILSLLFFFKWCKSSEYHIFCWHNLSWLKTITESWVIMFNFILKIDQIFWIVFIEQFSTHISGILEF